MPCLCLGEVLKPGHVYRTRDGAQFFVSHLERDYRLGTYAVAMMLNPEGLVMVTREHRFGLHGEFCWPHNQSSPSDLVEEVSP